MNKCILILVLFFFVGCKRENCIVETSKENDDKITKQKVDKCNDNRIIENQEFYKNSNGEQVANGVRKKYYRNGNVMLLEFYKMGKLDSVSTLYYENGNIKRENFFVDNVMFGPQSHFRENGKLESLEFYTHKEVNWATIELDDDGNFTSVKGKLLHITVDDKSPYFDSIPIQSPLLLLTEVATIKGVKSALRMTIKQKDKIMLDTTISKFLPFFNSYLTGIKYPFKKKGDYDFIANVILTGSVSGKEIYSDTFSKKITVY